MSMLTHSIRHGRDVDAAEFITGWAKLRGGLAHMREERADAPIRLCAVSPYRGAALRHAKEQLEKYRNMPLEKAEALVENAYKINVEHQKRQKEGAEALRQKYTELLEKVNKWEPPTLQHLSIKEDAVNDLKRAIQDCILIYIDYEKEDAQEYIDYHIRYYEKEVMRAEAALEEEKKAVAERNQWITDLLKSLEETYEN